MEDHGGNIYDKDIRIDFSVNVNPFGMPEAVKGAAIRGVEESFRYPDPEQRKLRQAISAAFCIPAERIVAGSGAAELIWGITAALQPGKALVCAPSFGEYEGALLARGCQVERFYLGEENDWLATRELVRRTGEEPGLEILFLCHPNNPTGRLVPAEILEDLARVCHERKITLVVDECFLDLTREGEAASALALQRDCPELLVLRAFTKMYAMPGLRLGWLAAGREETAERIRRMLPPWNVSWPAQMAGCAALKEQEFARRSAALLLEEREWLSCQLRKLGFRVWPSETTFLLFEGPKDLQDVCLKEGIYIRDGASFPGLWEGTWRIGVRTRQENQILLEVLGRIMKERKMDRWQK